MNVRVESKQRVEASIHWSEHEDIKSKVSHDWWLGSLLLLIWIFLEPYSTVQLQIIPKLAVVQSVS